MFRLSSFRMPTNATAKFVKPPAINRGVVAKTPINDNHGKCAVEARAIHDGINGSKTPPNAKLFESPAKDDGFPVDLVAAAATFTITVVNTASEILSKSFRRDDGCRGAPRRHITFHKDDEIEVHFPMPGLGLFHVRHFVDSNNVLQVTVFKAEEEKNYIRLPVDGNPKKRSFEVDVNRIEGEMIVNIRGFKRNQPVTIKFANDDGIKEINI